MNYKIILYGNNMYKEINLDETFKKKAYFS